MTQYFCQCGAKLKAVKATGSKKTKTNTSTLSYKVLIVRTETRYKCPNECKLIEVKVIK